MQTETIRNNENLQRYALALQYNGKNYHGWQVQQGALSVQGVLQESLSNVLRMPIHLFGCGRTDSGVHARYYVAHFDAKPMGKQEKEHLLWKMNVYLPFDIRLLGLKEVKQSFNARFDALSRTYKYYISQTKQPFNNEFSFFCPFDLDIEKMNEASLKLCGCKDFTSFSKVHTQVNNFNCDVMFAHWERENELIVFTVKANRFLRNMVRALVGTLLMVGRRKITVDEFIGIVEAKDRKKAGVSVDAKGLFLEDIEYKDLSFR
ncbi:MAG: tRNA pseudouridine(38-40) synthase TruA [Bacteroidales bacterium]|nr:tRNA pseudouridine(38-40) synthase TruA [Bacteroidales bacterium]